MHYNRSSGGPGLKLVPLHIPLYFSTPSRCSAQPLMNAGGPCQHCGVGGMAHCTSRGRRWGCHNHGRDNAMLESKCPLFINYSSKEPSYFQMIQNECGHNITKPFPPSGYCGIGWFHHVSLKIKRRVEHLGEEKLITMVWVCSGVVVGAGTTHALILQPRDSVKIMLLSYPFWGGFS